MKKVSFTHWSPAQASLIMVGIWWKWEEPWLSTKNRFVAEESLAQTGLTEKKKKDSSRSNAFTHNGSLDVGLYTAVRTQFFYFYFCWLCFPLQSLHSQAGSFQVEACKNSRSMSYGLNIPGGQPARNSSPLVLPKISGMCLIGLNLGMRPSINQWVWSGGGI